MVLAKLKLFVYQAIVVAGFFFLTRYLQNSGKSAYYILVSGVATVLFAILTLWDLGKTIVFVFKNFKR